MTALESGDYKQGRDRLRDGDDFCCLGVACDLSDSLNGGKDPIEVEADGWLAYGNGVSECPYKYYQDLARHHAWNKGWWGAHQELSLIHISEPTRPY